MTVPRKQLIDLQSTPYYHVMNRCVRRAFLCGVDHYSGHCYEHRRQWIVDKIKFLSSVFAIDICAYAIMSNHYHLVLRVNQDEASQWSAREVIRRWCQVYGGPSFVHDYLALEPQSASELYMINELARVWRNRLHDISWFMRSLNEYIARQANAEDECKGRFWQGRFKSQALLDEGALLTCMVYVDLNPIRAGIATSLETSDYTSIKERIVTVAKTLKLAKKRITQDSQATSKVRKSQISTSNINDSGTIRAKTKFQKPLLGFIGSQQIDNLPGIPYNLIDYFSLIEWTGGVIRGDIERAILNNVKPLLHRLSLNANAWVDAVREFKQRFGIAIGSEDALRRYSHNLSSRWLHGKLAIQRLYL